MYKLVDMLLNVLDFEASRNKISVIQKDLDGNCILKINQKSVLKFGFRSLTRGLQENFTIVSDESKTIYIFNSFELVKKIKDFSLSEKAYSQCEIVISKRTEKGKYDKFIYNILSENLQSLKTVPTLVAFKSCYFVNYEEKKLLKSLSLLTGEYEWELDLGVEGLEIAGILGIKDTNLIVACTNKQNQVIWLAFDVANGKEIWRRYLQVSSGGGANAFSEDKTSLFNLHAGGLWLNGIPLAQGNHIFREINVTDGSIKREGILSDVDEAGLGVKNFTLYGDKIYFTARYNGSFGPIAIGVLDYETLSLLWWEEVQMQEADGFGNFFLNQPIQVSENKIYVLDKTHVLHIYERDESVAFVKPSKSGLRAFEDLPTSFDNTDNQNMGENKDLPF